MIQVLLIFAQILFKNSFFWEQKMSFQKLIISAHNGETEAFENRLTTCFAGWKYKNFTPDEVEVFLKNYDYHQYPHFLLYLRTASAFIKKQIFLFFNLFINGGIILDPLVQFLHPIPEEFYAADAVFIKSNMNHEPTRINTMFIMTKPKNPVFLVMIDRLYRDGLKMENIQEQFLNSLFLSDLSNTFLLEQSPLHVEGGNSTIYWKKSPFLSITLDECQ